MIEFVDFIGLPIPPSENNMYVNAQTHRGRFKSRELIAYQKAMVSWAHAHERQVLEGKNTIRQWLNTGRLLELWIVLVFTQEELWTKKGTPRRFDAANRIKAAQDSICHIMGIDDCIVFRTTVEKVQGPVRQMLIRYRPRRVDGYALPSLPMESYASKSTTQRSN